ncbi:MAG: hypothetical protein J1E81_06145 [Eubacterium sp.]|nr:hypothetical protein [Eubacterium sp.]
MEAQTQKAQQNHSSWKGVMERFRGLMGNYADLPMDAIYSAFGRAMGGYWANQPNIQNARVKAINPLPADVTKEELGEFLRNPQNSELPLQQVSEGLKWTNYSWFKTIKSYADMLQFHSYALPIADEIKDETVMREGRLVDKLLKKADLRSVGHKIAGQAETQGKVYYMPRYSVDKSHNAVNSFFLQEIPKGWTTIIGFNNISKYTVSFNLMYFMTPGTDYRQFGDLFTPYMEDFNEWVTSGDRKAFREKHVYYASRNNTEFESEVRAWAQDGRWYYYVSLPIDRVFTFEIDDTTAIVASPLAGLMQTFTQQSDYEAAQLSLIMNPLIKIFTGEIPYYNSNEAKEDDGFRLSVEMRAVFEAFFRQMMVETNTGGAAFYTAPVQNIKSHDYAESANANDISQSFLNYGVSKSGLSSLVATTPDPHQGFQEYAGKLESKYSQVVYRDFERMLNYILFTLNLNYEWRVQVFGDIYSDNQVRANALKELDKGDLSQYFVLAALDDVSVFDKVTMNKIVHKSGLLELLQPPPSANTQSSKTAAKSDTGGAPTKTETEITETKTEKSIVGDKNE